MRFCNFKALLQLKNNNSVSSQFWLSLRSLHNLESDLRVQNHINGVWPWHGHPYHV